MNTIGTYNNTKSILSQAIEWINVLSAIYLIITFVFPFEYQRPALYAYFSSLTIDIIINQRYKNVEWHKSKLVFIPMILFYLAIWIWHIFEDTAIYQFTFAVENRLPFLIFGILGLFTNINPKLKPQYIAIPMLITPILCAAYLIISKIQISNILASDFSYYQNQFELYRISVLKASHMDFNLYMNLAILFGLYALYTFKEKWLKVIISICMTLTFGLLLTSEGRVGFFTGAILLSGSIAFYIKQQKTKLILPTFFLIIFCLMFVITNHKHIKNTSINEDTRVAIWEHAFKVIKEKPILGYGVSDGRTAFINNTDKDEKFYTNYLLIYSQSPKCHSIYRAHPHNVFLESIIEFGIIGLILICSIMILPIISTKGKQRLFVTILIFIFGLQSMFEVLRDYLPPIYLSWFLYIFILSKIDTKKITNH